jgi:hypothetical protein
MSIASTVSKQIMLGDSVIRVWPFTFRALEGAVSVFVKSPSGDITDVISQCRFVFNDSDTFPCGQVTYPVSPDVPALPGQSHE